MSRLSPSNEGWQWENTQVTLSEGTWGRQGLEDWHFVVPLLRAWLDEWAALLSRVPEGVTLAVVFLPVALAIFSKRITVVLACILLAIIIFCAFVVPSNTTVVLATGIYLGSLIVALSGIGARRKAGAVQAELASLREDVNGLLAAEERRYLTELRSTTKDPDR
jgi:hypothetical protein